MTNRTFEELEARCKAMNSKRYIKISLALLVFFVLIAFLCMKFFYNPKPQKINKVVVTSNTKVLNQDIEMPKEVKVEEVKRETAIQKVVKTKRATNQKVAKQTVAKQSIQKKSEKIEKERVEEKTDSKKEIKREQGVDKKSPDNSGEVYDTLFLKPNIFVPRDGSDANIKKRRDRGSSKKRSGAKKGDEEIQRALFEDERLLLKRNRANEGFDTTLRLSKYYYKISEYQKAIYWLKKANKYRPSSFEPWLIYAKIKIKQNKRDDAIKAVEAFLSYFDSEDARKFLIKIKRK